MVSDLQRQRDQEMRERKWNEQARERMEQHTGIEERIREKYVSQEPVRQPEPKPQAQPQQVAQPKPEPKKSIITKITEKARVSDIKKDLGRDIKQGLKNAYNSVPTPKLPGVKKPAVRSAPKRRPAYRRRTYRQQREYVEEQPYQAPLPRPQVVKSPFDSGIYTSNQNTRPKRKQKPESGYGSISAMNVLFGNRGTSKSSKKQTSSSLFDNNLSSISTMPGLHYGMGTKKTPQKKTVKRSRK